MNQHSDTQRRIHCLTPLPFTVCSQNMNDQKKAVEAYVAAVKINRFSGKLSQDCVILVNCVCHMEFRTNC